MNTVKENLIKAKALIDTPEKWGKGRVSFSYNDTHTCVACAHEALKRVVGIEAWDTSGGEVDEAVAALKYALPRGYGSTPEFNDHPNTTHDDIMALYDRAIAASE